MNWLLVLFCVYISYFIFLLFITEAKILSPAFIYVTSFLVTIGLALVFQEDLYFSLNKKTFLLVTISGTIMFFVELFYIIIGIIMEKKMYDSSTKIEKSIIIKESFRNIVFVLSLFFVFLSLLSLFINTWDGTFTSRMYTYKIKLTTNAGSIKLHFIVGQIMKILSAIIYVLTYVWIYNCSKAKIKIKEIFGIREITVIISYIVGSFIAQGARQPAIEYILYFILIYSSLNLRSRQKKSILKIITLILITIPLLGAAYYYTMALAGRSQTPRKLLEYIAANYSGGLYYLNAIIDKPASSEYFGQYSFNLIYKILSKIGLADDRAYISVHPFGRYGNTLTILGRWYEDFGDIGVYIISGLVIFLFCYFFYCKVYKKNSHQHIYKIFYCKLILIMVWAGYDDGIRGYLSVGGIIALFLIYFFEIILIEKKIKIRFGNIKLN